MVDKSTSTSDPRSSINKDQPICTNNDQIIIRKSQQEPANLKNQINGVLLNSRGTQDLDDSLYYTDETTARKPTEISSARKKTADVSSKIPKSVKSVGISPAARKSVVITPAAWKTVETLTAARKPVEISPEAWKTVETPTAARKSMETSSTTRKSVEAPHSKRPTFIAGAVYGPRNPNISERKPETAVISLRPVAVKRTMEAKQRSKSTGDYSPRKSQAARQSELPVIVIPLMPIQNFNYFLVVNFQATCDVHSRPQPQPREIMEFSVAKVNGQTFVIEAQFHQYVCPKINKKLSKFCTQLTGVSQCMVDGQPGLVPTMKKLHVWIYEQGLYKSGVTFSVVSHGDWDLRQLLPRNIQATTGSSIPDYFRKWIDISKIFKLRTGTDASEELDELNGMLKMFDLKFEGPRHSGIYVCYNVIQIMKALAAVKQCVFTINSP